MQQYAQTLCPQHARGDASDLSAHGTRPPTGSLSCPACRAALEEHDAALARSGTRTPEPVMASREPLASSPEGVRVVRAWMNDRAEQVAAETAAAHRIDDARYEAAAEEGRSRRKRRRVRKYWRAMGVL